MTRSRDVVVAALCLAVFASLAPLSTSALGQTYPVRPIHLVVGQPPGGHSDVLARIVAQRFSELLHQAVVVENRAGAGGTIGAEIVARSPADGYTLLFAGSNNLALASLQIRDLRYQPSDFAPVGTIARVSYALAVNAQIPVTTIAELVAYVRAHPGELNYGSSGVSSTSHLMLELLKRSSDIDIVHIPYKGSALAVQELAHGRIHLMFNDLSMLMPHVRSGSVRLIAVAGEARSAAAPAVTTVDEQGFGALATEPWYGIVVPAATPRDIVAKLADTLLRTLRTPEVRQRFEKLGYVPIETSPEQLAAIVRGEMTTFKRMIDAAFPDAGEDAPRATTRR